MLCLYKTNRNHALPLLYIASPICAEPSDAVPLQYVTLRDLAFLNLAPLYHHRTVLCHTSHCGAFTGHNHAEHHRAIPLQHEIMPNCTMPLLDVTVRYYAFTLLNATLFCHTFTLHRFTMQNYAFTQRNKIKRHYAFTILILTPRRSTVPSQYHTLAYQTLPLRYLGVRSTAILYLYFTLPRSTTHNRYTTRQCED